MSGSSKSVGSHISWFKQTIRYFPVCGQAAQRCIVDLWSCIITWWGLHLVGLMCHISLRKVRGVWREGGYGAPTLKYPSFASRVFFSWREGGVWREGGGYGAPTLKDPSFASRVFFSASAPHNPLYTSPRSSQHLRALSVAAETVYIAGLMFLMLKCTQLLPPSATQMGLLVLWCALPASPAA